MVNTFFEITNSMYLQIIFKLFIQLKSVIDYLILVIQTTLLFIYSRYSGYFFKYVSYICRFIVNNIHHT